MLHPHLELFPAAISRLRKIEKILQSRGIALVKFDQFLDHEYDPTKMTSIGHAIGYAQRAISKNLNFGCLLYTKSQHSTEKDIINPLIVQVELGFLDNNAEDSAVSAAVANCDVTNGTWKVVYEPLVEPGCSIESALGIEFAEHCSLPTHSVQNITPQTAYTVIRMMADFYAAHAKA